VAIFIQWKAVTIFDVGTHPLLQLFANHSPCSAVCAMASEDVIQPSAESTKCHKNIFKMPSQQQVYLRIFKSNSTFMVRLQDKLDCFQSCMCIFDTWWWLEYTNFWSLWILGLLFITIDDIFWCSQCYVGTAVFGNSVSDKSDRGCTLALNS